MNVAILKNVSLAAVLCLPNVGFSDEATEASGEGEQNPGFFDQWREMKGIEQREVSTELYKIWRDGDARQIEVKTSLRLGSRFATVKFLGPSNVGGRTRAVLIDRCNDDRIFAGAISGGLWYSADRGASWAAVDDGAANLAVSGIAQSPFDHQLIYYCTGEARANTAGILGDGLFKSSDGGASFVHLRSTTGDSRFGRCWCVVHARAGRHTLYVGTETGGLLKSEDGGDSWLTVLTQFPVTDAICFASGAVMAAVSGDGIYCSTSGDAGTFEKLSSDEFPSEFQRVELAECATQPNNVYAAFESPKGEVGVKRVCVSRDCGRVWTRTETPKVSHIYNRYCFALGVHPCDPDLVFCAARFPLFSRDGGATWTRANNSHSDYHALVTFNRGTDRFLVGNDGGVYEYRWSNPRASATDLNHGYHVTQFYAGNYAAEGDFAIGGTQDNGTYRIDDSEQHRVYGGDGTHCHISLQDPNLAYASSQYANIVRCEDFLAEEPTWKRINKDATMNAEGHKFLNPFQVNRVDDQQLYCRTNEAIWRSLDGGDHWMRLSSGSVEKLYAIACSEHGDPVLYYGGGNASLFRVDHAASTAPGSEHDLSETAPEQLADDFMGSIAIHPVETGTILASFTNFASRPRIWKVTGADTADPTWHNVSGNLPDFLPVNCIQVDPADPEQSYFAATDYGLYYTSDGGLNWFKEERIPNVSIHELKLRASDRSLFLFTHGRGVWKLEPI